MVYPGRKLKKILLLSGITGAVYLGFRFLLPLVVPFLFAYGTALCLRPSVRFLEHRIRIPFRGKQYRIPAVVIGSAELTVLFVCSGIGIYLLLREVFELVNRFFAMFPQFLCQLDEILTGICKWAENALGLKSQSLVSLAADMIAELGDLVKTTTMPAIMTNSVTVLKLLFGILVFLVLFFVSTLLFLQEMEYLREKKSNSMFHKEFAMIGRRLSVVGNAWLKTQIMILAVTAVVCVIGLFLIRNPYALVLGIGIGFMDALPFLGAGVVLIPWGIIMLAWGKWIYGTVLLGLYVVCYLVRQFMETKIMGNKMGLSALETLISMYVGLQLFGIAGVILGPIGLLLVEDLLDMYWTEESR